MNVSPFVAGVIQAKTVLMISSPLVLKIEVLEPFRVLFMRFDEEIRATIKNKKKYPNVYEKSRENMTK